MRFVSLKYKLLFILTIFPVLGVGTYVLVARHLFVKDKTAYIYDSSLALTKALATQFDAKLQHSLETAKLFSAMKEVSSQNQDEVIFKNKELTSYAQLTLLKNGDIKTKKNFQSEDYVDKLNKEIFLDLISEVEKSEVAFKNFDEQVLLLKKDMSFSENTYDLMTFNPAQLFQEAIKKTAFNVFLVSKSGEALTHLKTEDEDIPESKFLPLLTQYLKAQQGHYGTKEFEDLGLITSHAFVSSGNFYVVSVVPRAIAFRAVSDLVYKSILFYIIIVSGGFIVAYFSANQLTDDLIKLTTATQKVAEGNFEFKTELHSKVKDEVSVLGENFSVMRVEIARLLKELDDYAKTLELKVEQRTAELNHMTKMQRSLLDSLGQGFLILNKEGHISDIRTRICDELFSQEVAGKNFMELIPGQEEDRKSIQQWVSFLYEEKIPFDDLKGVGPQELENQKKRHISLNYKALRGEDEKIEGIAVIATDDTTEIMAVRESQRQAKIVKMIDSLIRHKNQVIETVLEIDDLLSKSDSVLSSKVIDVRSLFLHFHTIKGNASSFDMVSVTQIAHHLEETLSPFLAGGTPDEGIISSVRDSLEQLKKEVTTFKKEYAHLLGSFDKTNRMIEVASNKLDQFGKKLLSTAAGKSLFPEFCEQFLSVSAVEQLRYIQVVAQETAMRQQKKIAEIQFIGSDAKIPRDHYSKLFSSFVHIIRNAIVHGIESPETRLDLGKKEEGQIIVEVSENLAKKSFTVSFSDDGAGIDVETVRQKLIEKGDPSATAMTDQQIFRKLLLGEISSKSGADLDAGRGVGVAAVNQELMKIGGQVQIESKQGQGTKFIFELPHIETANLNKVA